MLFTHTFHQVPGARGARWTWQGPSLQQIWEQTLCLLPGNMVTPVTLSCGLATYPSGQQSQSPGASRQRGCWNSPSHGPLSPGGPRARVGGLCFAGVLSGENANVRPPPSRRGRTGQGGRRLGREAGQVFLTEGDPPALSPLLESAKQHVTPPTPPQGWTWSKTGGGDPTEASSWIRCPLLPSPIGNRGSTLRRPASSPSILPSPGLGGWR